LKKNLQEQFIVLQAANRIAHHLNKKSDLQKAINNLIGEFLDLVKADEGSIQLLRPSSRATRCTLIRESENGPGFLDKQLDDFLTGWILKNKRPLISDDLSSLLEMVKLPKRYSGIRSVLTVPVLTEKKTIGTINLIRTQSSQNFNTSDKLLIADLAAQIGDFIEGTALREWLFSENDRLRKNIGDRFSLQGIIGQSEAIKFVFGILENVIPTDARVVITGESGTGKELIAKCLHYAGPRKDRPFVAVDCGALPTNLLESELFGYVRGAFTGANQDRRGLIEAAHTGTLFLDEITNMSIEVQAKLLRVLQEGEFRPLGSNQTKKVDVRVIVAASSNLEEQVTIGTFRSDLFYRLNVVSIHSPPLRERKEDIPMLTERFLNRFAEKHKKRAHSISPEALQILERYYWPGNIRELENIIERAVVLMHFNDTTLLPQHLAENIHFLEPTNFTQDLPTEGDLSVHVDRFEREILMRVLQKNKWNQSAAAQALNISEAVMRYKMKHHHIYRPK
jgi:transcriptional regulator with GAF, ATPase, and Fis domain